MQFPHIVFRFPSQSQHGCPFLYPSFPPYLSSWFTPVPSHCPHGFNPVPRHIGHRTFFSPAPAVAASLPPPLLLLLLRTNPTPPTLLLPKLLGKTCRRRREEEEEEEEEEEIEKERDGVVVFSAYRLNILSAFSRARKYKCARVQERINTPNCVVQQNSYLKPLGKNTNPLHIKSKQHHALLSSSSTLFAPTTTTTPKDDDERSKSLPLCGGARVFVGRVFVFQTLSIRAVRRQRAFANDDDLLRWFSPEREFTAHALDEQRNAGAVLRGHEHGNSHEFRGE
jgi:hypothetical protein